jgi:hypothetical protein
MDFGLGRRRHFRTNQRYRAPGQPGNLFGRGAGHKFLEAVRAMRSRGDQIDLAALGERRQHRPYFPVLEHYLMRVAAEVRRSKQRGDLRFSIRPHSLERLRTLRGRDVRVRSGRDYVRYTELRTKPAHNGGNIRHRLCGRGRKVGGKQDRLEANRHCIRSARLVAHVLVSCQRTVFFNRCARQAREVVAPAAGGQARCTLRAASALPEK